MACSLDERRRAYICFRPVFEEAKGECREKKQIRKLLQNHPALQALRAQIGHQKLLVILRKQVSDGIFDSELRAWQDFPDLFSPDSEPLHLVLAQQVASEAQKHRDAGKAQEDRDDGPAGGVPVMDDELGLAEIMSTSSGDQDESGVPRQTTHEEGMTLLSVGAGTLAPTPPLPEHYLPYSAQHAILSTTQTMLEEACFAFAQKHLPSLLDESGFDCPAAVELTKWTKILSKHRYRLVANTPTLKDPSISRLLVSARKLRNIAVHRVPTTAVEVARLVGAAAALAETLQDHERAAALQVMHGEIKEKLEVIEVERRVLRQQADLELEEIRRAREELDRRAREVAAGILREDASRRRAVGKLLEEAAGRAGKGGHGAPDIMQSVTPDGPDSVVTSVSQENTEQGQDTDQVELTYWSC